MDVRYRKKEYSNWFKGIQPRENWNKVCFLNLFDNITLITTRDKNGKRGTKQLDSKPSLNEFNLFELSSVFPD